MAEQEIFDVAVIGAGPAGLIAGAACAKLSLRTVVIGPPSNPLDQRTSALFGGSIELLKKLEIWDRLRTQSEPITGIRIVDGSANLIRAPEVLFDAHEAGFEAFGYNIPNVALVEALEATSRASHTRVAAGVTRVDIGTDFVTLTCGDEATVTAKLAVAADGRRSSVRAAAGIEISSWS
nr:FAD-dependent monooxygenase [Hyphomicrobium sp.]